MECATQALEPYQKTNNARVMMNELEALETNAKSTF
jgi:hypothetical protein